MDHKEPESIQELFAMLSQNFVKIIYRIIEGFLFYCVLYIFAYITTVIMESFPPYLFDDVANDQAFQSWLNYVKIGLNYFTLFVFALYVIHVLHSTALDLFRRIISDTISFGQWLLDLKNRRKEPSLASSPFFVHSSHLLRSSTEHKPESDHVDDLRGLRGNNPIEEAEQ